MMKQTSVCAMLISMTPCVHVRDLVMYEVIAVMTLWM